jgi:hypothetical protein
MNHHTTCLANPLPHRASSTDATTDRGWPVEIRYTARSEKSMRQMHHPAAGPIRLSNRQGARARVLGLDSRTELLSRRWRKESGTEEDEGDWVRFGVEGDHRWKSKWRSKRGSNRSSDDGSSDADKVIRAGGARGGSCSACCMVWINPNCPLCRALL